MKKKEIEEYIRNAAKGAVKEKLNSDEKERIWNNIKTAVEAEKVQPKKKKQLFVRYPVISCAATCLLIVLLAVAAKQYIFDGSTPITGDSTLNIASSSSETPSKVSSVVPAVREDPLLNSKPEGTLDAPLIEVRPQNIVVVNHRLYRYNSNTKIDENDIDKAYSEIVGGMSERVYSLREKKLEVALALQINGVYLYYECIYDGVFSFKDKEYRLEDITQNNLDTYKGKYLGETDGLKLFVFVDRESAILVDVSPLLDSEQKENLIVAVTQD